MKPHGALAGDRIITERQLKIAIPDTLRHSSEDGPLNEALAAIARLNRDDAVSGPEGDEVVTDYADQLLVRDEEPHMLYNLLPAIATKVSEREIGRILVRQAEKILECDRVSLLLLDEDKVHLRVLASVGLPREAQEVRIPIGSSVAGRILADEKPFEIEDICQRPDLSELTVGTYQSTKFAVLRFPMRNHGEPVGVLTATECRRAGEFAPRDLKLLEGLLEVGAASLTHCRLHAAVRQQMIGAIRALAAAVDAKDHYTHDHSSRVSRCALVIGRMMGIADAETLREIELAGQLHDIGKIGVPDSILLKSSGLTRDEFEVVKKHAEIGANIVNRVKGLERVSKAILHHHERWDGRGYPEGLEGQAIPLIARMIAVADAFDSLTSDRSYRGRVRQKAALGELRTHQGAQFDSKVVSALEEALKDPAVSLFEADT
jgi:putative nucleotidyltransferase with HDIG domain